MFVGEFCWTSSKSCKIYYDKRFETHNTSSVLHPDLVIVQMNCKEQSLKMTPKHWQYKQITPQQTFKVS